MLRLLAKILRVARPALKIGSSLSSELRSAAAHSIPEIQLHGAFTANLLRMRCDETRGGKWSSHIQMSIQESKAVIANIAIDRHTRD